MYLGAKIEQAYDFLFKHIAISVGVLSIAATVLHSVMHLAYPMGAIAIALTLLYSVCILILFTLVFRWIYDLPIFSSEVKMLDSE